LINEHTIFDVNSSTSIRNSLRNTDDRHFR